jgi:hypothetical protein
MKSNRYCAFGGRVLVPRELRPGHWYIVGLPGRGMRRGLYVASRWGWRATRVAAPADAAAARAVAVALRDPARVARLVEGMMDNSAANPDA